MGLTRNSKNFKSRKTEKVINKNDNVIALLGNPNVGKTTLFNLLTGFHNHTGNWPGKTVSNSEGILRTNKSDYAVVDLPGIYSLNPYSEEEFIAKEFIEVNDIKVILLVIDATSLQRNLNLVLEARNIKSNIIVCLNLIDEAKKKKIDIDIKKLELELKLPVVGIVARTGFGVKELLSKIDNYENVNDTDYIFDTEIEAKRIYDSCVTLNNYNYNTRDIKIDKILTSKKTGIPIMILTLGLIFWITIIGANYPSLVLTNFFNFLYDKLNIFLIKINLSPTLIDFLLNGIYKIVSWIISVMLPPMAIFFPLFSLFEDLGYLPRIAFNTDKVFRKCGTNGKQALTMCMGYGCNACGVIGCRIIPSFKEKLISIITNVFSPCNGRFPSLIVISSMFFVSKLSGSFVKSISSALILLAMIIFSIIVTLLISKVLSKTILKGESSSFTLELPPYRRPKIIDTIVRSILDRTIFVLGRAIMFSIPAGIIIWLFSNVTISNVTILDYFTNFFNPFGKLIGLDGAIIMAFILGMAANEIVIPLLLMIYTGSSILTDYSSTYQLQSLLIHNGWSSITAICFMVFTICHFPCGTTILTIKKELGSIKWTIISIVIPTVTGIVLCFIISNLLRLFI